MVRACFEQSVGVEVKGNRKQGRPKKIWEMQVEESKSVGLEKKDATNQARWRVEVGEITAKM